MSPAPHELVGSAIEVAEEGLAAGELPIGAVLTMGDEVVGRAYTQERFGAVSVALPAYAAGRSGHDSAGLAGLLLAVWGLGSGLGGLWYGAWPLRSPLSRQLAWLLGCVALSLAALAVMPDPTALGVALALGGGVIAPCLTVYISLVGRIVPTGMLTEAHTWIATVPVAANAVGGATAGAIVDRPGGVMWAFVMAGAVVAIAAVTAVAVRADHPGGHRS